MENVIAQVNTEKCAGVAKIISSLVLKKDFYQRDYLQHFTSNETLLRMHFFAVAICHQTHHLYHPGLQLFGWDYLEHVFVKLAKDNSDLINPLFLVGLQTENLINGLKPEFSYDGSPVNCTLDRLDQRASLMIESSEKILAEYGGKLTNLIEKCDGYLLKNGNGLYELLPLFEAFSDPLQKKSTFLIKLLMEAGLIHIKDPENFIPIMDYHMQRVLLRLGCVEISDENYRKDIISRKVLKTDEPIRSLCVEAFRFISNESGHPVTKMNDFFWSIGRSCCHQTTLCTDHRCEKSPCTFTQIVELKNHDHCTFQEICQGAFNKKYRDLWQPVVETHFY